MQEKVGNTSREGKRNQELLFVKAQSITWCPRCLLYSLRVSFGPPLKLEGYFHLLFRSNLPFKMVKYLYKVLEGILGVRSISLTDGNFELFVVVLY